MSSRTASQSYQFCSSIFWKHVKVYVLILIAKKNINDADIKFDNIFFSLASARSQSFTHLFPILVYYKFRLKYTIYQHF